MWRRLGASMMAMAVGTAPVAAAILEGTQVITLHPNEGEPIAVGEITFAASGDGAYTIYFDDTLFANHFLSMRPFKCLEGTEKLWCRVSYPYEIKHRATTDDLTDLEYDLMFVWKKQGEYGIDLWNGVYYRISPDGDRLVGTMHEIDMNILASPPEDGDLRPVTEGDLEEADVDSHWLPKLTIE